MSRTAVLGLCSGCHRPVASEQATVRAGFASARILCPTCADTDARIARVLGELREEQPPRRFTRCPECGVVVRADALVCADPECAYLPGQGRTLASARASGAAGIAVVIGFLALALAIARAVIS